MMRAIGGKALALAALALLCALQARTLLRAPEAWLPAAIEVSLAPGAELVLGRAELAAPQAGARHLRLRRDRDGAWFAASADGVQGLHFERHEEHGEQGLRSGARPAAAGLEWRLGATRYRIEAADAHAVRFSDGVHTWTYDGAIVLRDGMPLGACPGAGPGARLLGLYNRWTPAALAVARPLRFGGNLSCATQVGNAEAPAAPRSPSRTVRRCWPPPAASNGCRCWSPSVASSMTWRWANRRLPASAQ
jgi:cell division protein FtsW